ncbi:hypothetical protein AVEN_22285-1 [Araneus ventricosus]|uniref:Uncharacterized protein n=1 Tax=Araneus ventricosus TaxID=182803 RepID=A0A4Y2X7U5_ARAVE|nr:hypothetical protein AVEN_22285-1 [Araneus ventricosus]
MTILNRPLNFEPWTHEEDKPLLKLYSTSADLLDEDERLKVIIAMESSRSQTITEKRNAKEFLYPVHAEKGDHPSLCPPLLVLRIHNTALHSEGTSRSEDEITTIATHAPRTAYPPRLRSISTA